MGTHFELNDSENITCENWWDAAKTTHKDKFIALNAHFRKENGLKSMI